MKHKTFLTFLYLVMGFSGYVFAESDRMVMVDLGPLPKGLARPPATISSLNNQPLPKVLVLMTGYESFLAPDNPSFNVWTTIEGYQAGKLIYLGAILANFEETPQNVALQYQLSGGKNLKVTQQKTLPALRVVAFIIQKTLAPHTALYQITATIGKPTPGFPLPGEVIDSIKTRWVINSIR